MSYTANTASLLPNAGPQAYLQYASPVTTSTGVITITFPPISQGLQALVSVNVPNGTGYQTYMVYLNGSLIGSMIGNNPFGPLNLNGGDSVSISGPTVSGNGVMTGSIGPVGSISLSPVVASGGTSGSVAVATSVVVPNPSPGQGWSYTIPEPTPLRLVAVRGLLTTSSTAGIRTPILWQVTQGATAPSEESALSTYGIGPSCGWELTAAAGVSPPTQLQLQTVVYANELPSSSSTLYTNTNQLTVNATAIISNTTGSAISVNLGATIDGTSYTVFQAAIAGDQVLTVPLPGLYGTADVYSGVASNASAVQVMIIADVNHTNRYYSSFSGLLLPPGSTVEAVDSFQSGDQWSALSLTFTQN